MKIYYDLYDLDLEPLITLKGREYIAPIGSDVYFSDIVEDTNNNIICINFESKVIGHYYNVKLDILYVNCQTDNQIDESLENDIFIYNTIKNDKKL